MGNECTFGGHSAGIAHAGSFHFGHACISIWYSNVVMTMVTTGKENTREGTGNVESRF